jgi:hypothetical protein
VRCARGVSVAGRGRPATPLQGPSSIAPPDPGRARRPARTALSVWRFDGRRAPRPGDPTRVPVPSSHEVARVVERTPRSSRAPVVTRPLRRFAHCPDRAGDARSRLRSADGSGIPHRAARTQRSCSLPSVLSPGQARDPREKVGLASVAGSVGPRRVPPSREPTRRRGCQPLVESGAGIRSSRPREAPYPQPTEARKRLSPPGLGDGRARCTIPRRGWKTVSIPRSSRGGPALACSAERSGGAQGLSPDVPTRVACDDLTDPKLRAQGEPTWAKTLSAAVEPSTERREGGDGVASNAAA